MEYIKNIKYLLRDINIVRKKIEERAKDEENFNIFTILKKNQMKCICTPGFFLLYWIPAGHTS